VLAFVTHRFKIQNSNTLHGSVLLYSARYLYKHFTGDSTLPRRYSRVQVPVQAPVQERIVLDDGQIIDR
jgi:hypothetical protein